MNGGILYTYDKLTFKLGTMNSDMILQLLVPTGISFAQSDPMGVPVDHHGGYGAE